MLQLRHITKVYRTGVLTQRALNDISVNFRNSEFVSILGPSGSGKTTLLNIIGGLDRYDSGDVIIDGLSTTRYRDRDWDSYRNHTIGFIFQNYNLISHQSILTNVELALTISGISRKDRRKRAERALKQVGLEDQWHKLPNQMSGGQMQRVAIARALINDPDILLADEPTGALDSETSFQIMKLLREVAKERLVIMVTHNAELAEQYSTRIVKLRDGRITGDSNPYVPEKGQEPRSELRSMANTKMSFFTSLSLSFDNLRTKKGRTLLTSFAGSIGIIGIALILALSTSVNNYIASIQKDTMTSYPITISAESVDLSNLMGIYVMANGGMRMGQAEGSRPIGVFADYSDVRSNAALSASITKNNLTAFKLYLDNPSNEIQEFLGENGVVYTYNINFDVYTYDADGNLINTNADIEDVASSNNSESFNEIASRMDDMSMMMGGQAGSSNAKNFSALMRGTSGEAVSRIVTDSYEMLYGAWPAAFDEVVLVLDENNALPTETLYQLGFMTADEYLSITESIEGGEDADPMGWDYKQVVDRIFYLIPAADYYTENTDGTFSYVEGGVTEGNQLLVDAIELHISGIVRPKEGAANAIVSTAIGYTSMLTDYVIECTDKSAVVLAQEKTPEVNILTGMAFDAVDDTMKISDAKAYIAAMGISDKASLYQMILAYNAEREEKSEGSNEGQSEYPERGEIPNDIGQGVMPDAAGQAMFMEETELATAMDTWLEETPDNEILLSIYDKYISGNSYADNMKAFGKVSYDAPASISIYIDSFEAKEAVAQCIANYNEAADEDDRIVYTDYVELMTSSLTTIVDVISYILIAFIAVSLMVSCIMIGIITHISVLERTKEIGILRALGASKQNISQVFNAETVIIGFCAGLLGVGISALLTILINIVLQNLLGAGTLTVTLPILYAAILIALSIVITLLGGLLPAKKAAKQDPVIALRTE